MKLNEQKMDELIFDIYFSFFSQTVSSYQGETQVSKLQTKVCLSLHHTRYFILEERLTSTALPLVYVFYLYFL